MVRMGLFLIDMFSHPGSCGACLPVPGGFLTSKHGRHKLLNFWHCKDGLASTFLEAQVNGEWLAGSDFVPQSQIWQIM